MGTISHLDSTTLHKSYQSHSAKKRESKMAKWQQSEITGLTMLSANSSSITSLADWNYKSLLADNMVH